jgi:hypothetical protein
MNNSMLKPKNVWLWKFVNSLHRNSQCHVDGCVHFSSLGKRSKVLKLLCIVRLMRAFIMDAGETAVLSVSSRLIKRSLVSAYLKRKPYRKACDFTHKLGRVPSTSSSLAGHWNLGLKNVAAERQIRKDDNRD